MAGSRRLARTKSVGGRHFGTRSSALLAPRLRRIRPVAKKRADLETLALGLLEF